MASAFVELKTEKLLIAAPCKYGAAINNPEATALQLLRVYSAFVASCSSAAAVLMNLANPPLSGHASRHAGSIQPEAFAAAEQHIQMVMEVMMQPRRAPIPGATHPHIDDLWNQVTHHLGL
jgi:hypothetical protein